MHIGPACDPAKDANRADERHYPGGLLTARAFIGALVILDAVVLVVADDFFRLRALAVLGGILLNLLIFTLLLLSWVVGVLGHKSLLFV
ncbi:hypothetical protein [Massilia scottii]|uniref:hypothetical protein n=1 Tax=Massilia scottii TaxID=3057166 RepID=UPI0027965A06|nr:hypothetical protein [Massilia sp. CCM 9029]MDQ1834619.1 hypothetical protein [Massilia sp. CCM 9029]